MKLTTLIHFHDNIVKGRVHKLIVLLNCFQKRRGHWTCQTMHMVQAHLFIT